MQDLRAQQLKFEEDTDHAAAAERLEQLRQSAVGGDVNLPRAQRYIARAYADVKQSLDDALAVKTRGVGGKFKGWLRKVPTEVSAVLALRECISCVIAGTRNNKPVTIQVLARAVGKLLELEARIRDAETVNPMYMQKIHDQVQENATTSKAHLRKLYNVAYQRVMKDGADGVLGEVELLQLGKFGVQACIDAGVIYATHSYGAGGRMVAYELMPEVAEFLTDYTDSDVRLITSSASGAMLCPPDPWTNLRDGGYISERRKISLPLMSMNSIRKSERARLREEFTAEKMPMVFGAVNYLQSIPFSVHQPTLAAVQRLWMSGGGVLGVPGKSGPQKPAFPLGDDWAKADATPEEMAVFTSWKFACRQYYDDIKTWRGMTREISGFIRATRDRLGAMYFPMFFDKRGRLYYRGTPNPQGSDISKAALHFHEKKPLGPTGAYWLRVHIANCFGFDKKKFDVRARWTEENWTAILAGLEAPEDAEIFRQADSPWCMFSAAWELREALASGSPETYETGAIVHMDATCSGLQHFAAILRDPVGGRYVNLVGENDEEKQDIYSRVSCTALQAMELDSQDSDSTKARIALWWRQTGIPRGMAKKPVMTYVYGATLSGTGEFVDGYVQHDMGLKFPEYARACDFSLAAGRKLFQGIAATVPAAEAGMQWLRNVAKQMPKGQRMEWRSPTGFLVQHDYQDYDEVRVKLRSCGVTDVLMREYNEDTKPLQMQNAIAPNFVHALDASHITLTALDMQQRGLAMVGIHDSYGTHPCDVAEMHHAIRTQFVGMYGTRNVLAEFLWDVGGYGEVPVRGTLDLTQVLDSEFFFC